VLEADDFDQAARLVAHPPCARARGAIEIRAITMINDAEWERTRRSGALRKPVE